MVKMRIAPKVASVRRVSLCHNGSGNQSRDCILPCRSMRREVSSHRVGCAIVSLLVQVLPIVDVLEARASVGAIDIGDDEVVAMSQEGEEEDELFPPSLMQDSFDLHPRTEEIINLARADLDSANYTQNDLTGAVFAESSLQRADLSASDMRGAIFSRAVMFGAIIKKSDCTNALFDYVVLRGADLRQSLFINANFIRSDVEETQIDGADFTDAGE